MTTTLWPTPGDALDDMILADGAASVTSTLVPGTYPVAIGGHSYPIEVSEYRRRTLDAYRIASDFSATPGEQSLSTEGYWTRSQRTWLYGAGQTVFDSPDSGVDNLIQRQRWLTNWNCEPDVDALEGVRMLRRSETVFTSTNATPNAPGLTVAAGAYTYVKTNASQILRVDSAAATNCTGLVESPTAVASDGYTVWAATVVDATHVKFYQLIAGGTVFTAMSAGSQVVGTNKSVGRLFYGNGFLLACCGDEVHSVSSTGALNATIDTFTPVSNLTATPTSVTCSTNTWYFALTVAAVGDFPTPVYKLRIDDTGAFGKLSVALPSLGPSEIVNCIKAVAANQSMLVGTTKGFRLGTIDGDANISVGPLVPVVSSDTVGSPNFGVTEFAAFGSKILASYASAVEPFSADISSTFKSGRPENGTIMIDVGRFVDTLQPSWWYWWRHTTTTNPTTTSCFVAEHKTTTLLIERDQINVLGSTNLITPCTQITSWISLGFDLSKSFIDIEVFHDSLASGDSIAIYYQLEDQSTWSLAGTSQSAGTVSNPDPFPVRQTARRVRFAFVLTAGSAAQTTTPRVRRWMLRAYPAPRLVDEIIVPIILHAKTKDGDLEDIFNVFDTHAEQVFLRDLAATGAVTIYQFGTATEEVRVSKLEMQPAGFAISEGTGGYYDVQGILVVRLLTL